MSMTKVVKADPRIIQSLQQSLSKMETLEGERAKICPAYRLINYPRISPAAITAVIRGNKILLTHNAAFRRNTHILIAGFVEPGETIEECVHREIFEEVGIKVKISNISAASHGRSLTL